jgi:FixJ family two-component response regulator
VIAERKSTIAVVDDDSRILESLEDLLQSAGHSAHLFSSAESFLANEVISAVDCLITDIGMPRVDGFELRRRARIIRPDLPVIFITARDEAGDRAHAAVGGHHGFFRKPFDAGALLRAIDRAVDDAERVE